MSAPAGLILGTRGSALALAQSAMMVRELTAQHPGLTVEQRILETEGDVRADARFGPGDRGVFVKTLERALISGEIDFAVHSLKDLPSADTPGLVLAAVPRREDPRDVLVTPTGCGLFDLPSGATVGTGSPRRRSQLLHARSDLRVRGLRGNVDSRVARVGSELDAVVLAAAGLNRLAMQVSRAPIDPAVCLPAVGQGALALQARESDRSTIACLRVLEHVPTRSQVSAERAFLAELGGGCLAPASAFARQSDRALRIEAMVAATDGSGRHVVNCVCDPADGPDEARRLAQRLLERGAQRWLDDAREEAAGDG